MLLEPGRRREDEEGQVWSESSPVLPRGQGAAISRSAALIRVATMLRCRQFPAARRMLASAKDRHSRLSAALVGATLTRTLDEGSTSLQAKSE